MARSEIMERFLNDTEVAARVLDHIANGTTDVGDGLWREPVENYLCPDRFAAEKETVLRRTMTPYCPSAALAETGSYVARAAAGTPLVAVRDEEQRVRVFRNACRHRGTEVARGSGCARSLVCPYHAWTYRLSGELSHVPHEYGFPELDKSNLSLVEVSSHEMGGLVYVNQDGSGDTGWEDLPDMMGSGQRMLGTSEVVVQANWKIALEGLIEGYHIKPTHRQSFYPYGFDNLTLVETVGRNSRVTYPFRRIESLRKIAPESRDVMGLLTYVYHIFPNVFVTVLSHHTNVVVLEPLAIDSTAFITYTLTNRADGNPEEDAKAKRDAEFVANTGGAEDRAIVESIQRSIGTDANQVFTFGRFETAISHFHAGLTAALGG
jgi:phenylpropionate dioxygenase-like ring-hydroxylating dioxygenase large terminal subunit